MIMADFSKCDNYFEGEDGLKTVLESIQKVKSVKTIDFKFAEMNINEANITNFGK
jgi:hypothetical protein